MLTTTIPRKAEKLISYLKANGGMEMSEFLDKDNKPDLEAARSYAESLRKLHENYEGELIKIEQSYNKVRIILIP
jgi:hypothetical protein